MEYEIRNYTIEWEMFKKSKNLFLLERKKNNKLISIISISNYHSEKCKHWDLIKRYIHIFSV